MGEFPGWWWGGVERRGPITSVATEATCQCIVSLINGALTPVSAAEDIGAASGSLPHTHIFALVYSAFVKAEICLGVFPLPLSLKSPL